jgi:hypothetical protein
MPADLETLLTGAVGDVHPRPVDTAELWRRGRRQRGVRRAVPAVVAVAVVALVGAALTALGSRPDAPVGPIGDGRLDTTGWSRLPAGRVDVDAIVDASADDLEVVASLPGNPGPTALFDVRTDGTVVAVSHDPRTGGLMLRAPGDSRWRRLGMPVPFLVDDAGIALHRVQWGPDGRLYLTGMAPDAEARGRGLTQIAVVEVDGTVVGARENDGGQTEGLLFADGFAWQRQQSEEGRERWQPLAEVGGRVLPMPQQRAGEWEDEVAPDGMVARSGWREAPATDLLLDVRVGERGHEWVLPDDAAGLELPGPRAGAGLRTAFLHVTQPGDGPLAWLTGERSPNGRALLVVRADGTLRAVHLPGELDGGDPDVHEMDWLAVIGADDYLYWVGHDAAGVAQLVRYRHPLP